VTDREENVSENSSEDNTLDSNASDLQNGLDLSEKGSTGIGAGNSETNSVDLEQTTSLPTIKLESSKPIPPSIVPISDEAGNQVSTENENAIAIDSNSNSKQSNSKTHRVRKVILSIAIPLFLLSGLFAGGILFYFNSHAYLGTFVMDQDVSGKTKDEIAKVIQTKFDLDAIALAYKESANSQPLSKLFVTIDANEEAEKIIQSQKSSFSMIMPDEKKENFITPKIDLKSVTDFIDNKFKSVVTQPVNATIAYNSSDNSFDLVKGKKGDKIDVSPVKEAIISVVNHPSQSPINVKLKQKNVDPLITDDIANVAKDTANDWSKENSLFQVGETTLVYLTRAEVASLLQVKPDDQESKLDVTLSKDAVLNYVNNTLIPEANRDPKPSVIVTNRANKDTGFIEEGTKGYSLLEPAQTIADRFYTSFNDKKPIKMQLKATVTPNKETRVQRYVDIKLGAHTLQLVENGKVINTFSMYAGAAATPTIQGDYAVYLKLPVQTMRGTGIDGTPYVAPDVPWISYFQGDYAFHGTPYLDALGVRDQSHGCVNLDPVNAKIAYDFSPVGTEVLVEP
jgi:lipoprotein-anchoring transpeptidase ErfK/SrfK